MKLSIQWKLLILIMVLALVPLVILGFLSIGNISGMGDEEATNVDEMTSTAVEDSSAALENLGEKIVNSATISVRNQVILYLDAHPDATLEDLQNDDEFQAIAVQPIYEGENEAYTYIVNAHTREALFAHDEGMIGFEGLGSTLEAEGYEEAKKQLLAGNDGSFRFSVDEGQTYNYAYVCMPTADTITADGVPLICAGMISLEEFNAPAKQLEEALLSSKNNVIATIDDAKSNNQTSMWITVAATAVIVALLSLLFARGFTNPIKQLKDAADRVSMGDMSVSINVKSKDEIGELSESFDRMVTAVKYLSQDDDEE